MWVDCARIHFITRGCMGYIVTASAASNWFYFWHFEGTQRYASFYETARVNKILIWFPHKRIKILKD